MKQEMVGWQWQQLDRMHIICISLQTACQHLVTQFLQAGCSSWWRWTNGVSEIRYDTIWYTIYVRAKADE